MSKDKSNKQNQPEKSEPENLREAKKFRDDVMQNAVSHINDTVNFLINIVPQAYKGIEAEHKQNSLYDHSKDPKHIESIERLESCIYRLQELRVQINEKGTEKKEGKVW